MKTSVRYFDNSIPTFSNIFSNKRNGKWKIFLEVMGYSMLFLCQRTQTNIIVNKTIKQKHENTVQTFSHTPKEINCFA